MKKVLDYIAGIKPVDVSMDVAALDHINSLTKPPGSLGRMEEFALNFIRASNCIPPKLDKKTIFIMAGDHGVAQEGVSAFPAEVTPQMVFNFLSGGAAINVLARHAGIKTVVVDMGVNADLSGRPGLTDKKIGMGTKNIAKQPAMTNDEAERAIFAGIELAETAAKEGCHIIGTGDMGIANTTPSTALYCALLGLSPEEISGPGTGLDEKGVRHKAEVVKKAVALHAPYASPLDALAKLGGFEIAGLTGLILGAAKNNIPVVVDGFISSAAAMVAVKCAPAVMQRTFWSHMSNERGHKKVCETMGVLPILDLNLRLGEGTGAALAIWIIEGSVKIYNEMATFKNAGVSTAV
ncbi:MAG: nicotinate-nucleotide--dimethylbenzimidazole phosphoribosyltransferase [Nitrospinae bacterium]|nr:nicotinate-nucleotide--dimethylbenzimidazole phosphoribosyltransferase [Nitrospinota bacterium]